MRITREQMEDLSDNDIKLITYLGISIEEKTVHKKTMLKEYDLVVSKTCMTCGTAVTRLFRMTNNKNRTALEAVEVEAVGNTYRTVNYKVRCCGNCIEFLLNLSHAELAGRLLTELSNKFLVR